MTGQFDTGRVYDHYLSRRTSRLAPDTPEGLTSRAPFLDHVIHSHMPADRRSIVIDLGCGHGAMVLRLRAAGYINVIGIDASPEQIEAAARLGIGGLELGDLLEALQSRPDASADVAILFDVLEHFTRPAVFAIVDEIARVLKPGGRAIVHAPNGEAPFGGRIRYCDITHELCFTRESISQVFLGAGFTRVTSFECGPVAHGPLSAGRRVLWSVVRTIWALCLLIETGSAAGAIFSQNFLTVAAKPAS